jgi:hypothetical protein
MMQSLVLCRRWPKEEFAMANQYHLDSEMDLVSGAEVPKGEPTDHDRETITAIFGARNHWMIRPEKWDQVVRALAIARAEGRRVAEVPEAEIEVTPEMSEAGRLELQEALPGFGNYDIERYCRAVYRAMRRVELSRKELTT